MAKKSKVWVVIHCEFMQNGETYEEYRVDEMVFHVASTRKLAEKFIKARGVQRHSWWKIQPFDLDKDDGEGRELIYTYKGKQVHSAPYQKALKAYFKQCKEDDAQANRTNEKRDGQWKNNVT